MAKSRAQRKAERRKRQAERAESGQQPDAGSTTPADSSPEEPVDSGPANQLSEAREPAAAPAAPETVNEAKDRVARKQLKAEERDRKQRAKESERRRQGLDAPVEKERGAVSGFFRSVVNELGRVQWPNRDTLVQASGVTIVFVAIAAAYLGVLDAIFSRLIQLII